MKTSGTTAKLLATRLAARLFPKTTVNNVKATHALCRICSYLPKLGRVNSSPSRKLIHFVQFRDGASDSRTAAQSSANPSNAGSRRSSRRGWPI